MKDKKQQVSQSRRRFLRDSGIAGGTAAVAATLPGAVAAAPDTTQGEEKPEGYRLSNHILAYYKSAAS